jgi:hypothetical protein
VVWLVRGDVVVAGTVNLDGKISSAGGDSEPGPGGISRRNRFGVRFR